MAEPAPELTERTTLSSRTSRAAAGWEKCEDLVELDDVLPQGWTSKQRFSWIDPRPLWQSRNDRLARVLGDPTNEERRRWVHAQRTADDAPADMTVRRFEDRSELSFIVLGDTGEGDHSQYYVIPPLRAVWDDADFVFLCSDVIYPAGDVNEYDNKFFWACQGFKGPIYAIPGNHDWYDGLHGFMRHFCGAKAEARPPARPVGNALQRAARWATWRRTSRPDEARIEQMYSWRASPEQACDQPGPYFAIEAGEFLLVALDTGIIGTIDEGQGAWLRDVSRIDKPKILLTGKPLYVDARRKETPIEGGGTVNEIVSNPDNDYVAVIGGDIHNYQRYPVQVDGRTIQHIVCGAGGAYTHATHLIPTVTLEECACDEAGFRCYPRRGDSLAAYSRLYAERLSKLTRRPKERWIVPYDQAPKIVQERLKAERGPIRPEDRDVTIDPKAREAAERIFGKRGRASGALHHYFSEFLDWDDPPPPLFKSFMRVDLAGDTVEIRCYAATGCKEHATNPPLEDWVRGGRGPDGTWTWEVLLD